jgi:salicylate hydroxylase
VEDESKKLTIEEMNGYDMYKDIDQAFAEKRGVPYTDGYIKGLPVGFKLSNGVTVGE